MVAIGDFGCAERERMVHVSIERGWVHGAYRQATAAGIGRPVVLVVPCNQLGALPLVGVSSLRPCRAMRLAQRRAGCRPFVVVTCDFEPLAQCNATPGWRDDLEAMMRKGGTPVVRFERSAQFLVAVKSVKTMPAEAPA